MDLATAIVAKSDQLNADDLIAGPRTFTVAEVRQGDADQPVSIFLAEWPGNRPFKPSKTVTRILVSAWGANTDDWPLGARMTLFRDPKVKWAGQEVGGIRVSHLSHIDGPLKLALAESKGKKTLHTIKPLADVTNTPTPEPTQPEPTAEQVASCADRLTLQSMWRRSGPEMRATIEQRVADLANEPGQDEGAES